MTTLGILKAGRPPSTLAARFGSYPDMFIRLFGAETFDYRDAGAIKNKLKYFERIGARKSNAAGIEATLAGLRDRYAGR